MKVERETADGDIIRITDEPDASEMIIDPGEVHIEIKQNGLNGFIDDYYAYAAFPVADLRRFLTEVLAALPKEPATE